jgi:hypothetical protein
MIGMATANRTRGQSLIAVVVGPATTGVVAMADGLCVAVSMLVTTVGAGAGPEWVHAATTTLENVANSVAAPIRRRTSLLPRPCYLVHVIVGCIQVSSCADAPIQTRVSAQERQPDGRHARLSPDDLTSALGR